MTRIGLIHDGLCWIIVTDGNGVRSQLLRMLQSATQKRVRWRCWQDNKPMHAKPGLRVFLKWRITCPGSVIETVIQTRVFYIRIWRHHVVRNLHVGRHKQNGSDRQI